MCCAGSDRKTRGHTDLLLTVLAETFPVGPLQVDSAQEESEAPLSQSCGDTHPGQRSQKTLNTCYNATSSSTVAICQASSFVSARETHSARIWDLGPSIGFQTPGSQARAEAPSQGACNRLQALRRGGRGVKSLEGPLATRSHGNVASGLLFAFISSHEGFNGVDKSPARSLLQLENETRLLAG